SHFPTRPLSLTAPKFTMAKISPLLCALFHCPAQLRVVGPGHPLTATVGQDVVLPCHLSPQRDARTLDVRWIRDDSSETVHHYRNGEDLYGEQMGAYAGRTELARDGLSAGNLDLRIMGLRPSDDGQYVCTVGDADAYNEAIVELEVSASGHHPWAVTSSPLSFQHGESFCCLKIQVGVHWVTLCGASPALAGAYSGAKRCPISCPVGQLLAPSWGKPAQG
uniref:Ig-like domain-containing protein n=1 Tax=Anser brachyrhynchus TaxID=132585 RepID=A0A8B9BBX5_9AVES